MRNLPLASFASLVAAFVPCAVAGAQSSFVNWESPHVHPLDLTPDRAHLLAVNTPDARLEVLDVTGAAPVRAFDVPVGLDPVSVRARTNVKVPTWLAVRNVSDPQIKAEGERRFFPESQLRVFDPL